MSLAEAAGGRQDASRALMRIIAAIPAASGASVMGTGIVSVALYLDGRETLSLILLGVAGVLWVAIGLILAERMLLNHARFLSESRSPASLTGVAGTGVLGVRLSLLGWSWAGIVMIVIALALWLRLLSPVLRNWSVPSVGGAFLLTVSTESLALLASVLALREHAHWLFYASLVVFVLGLGFYLFVLARFDLRQLIVGRGDHWVSGGALAISTVTAGRITIAAKELGMLDSEHGTLRGIALGVWVATMLWLPALVIGEGLYRRLDYDVRRWSTVFPVGMYAACSFVVGKVAGVGAITGFARVWVWVAVVVWLVVFAGMLRRGLQLARGERQAVSSTDGVVVSGA